MNFIQDILNKKNATRAIPQSDFLILVPEMANALSQIDYHYHYTDEELINAWNKLKNYSTTDHYTASQQRTGMQLCEHFFPNFYDIKNNNGESFKDYWTPEKLQRILIWNRSSHSTPYLSELKRGVYFCYGLTKNTMYRPHLAKMINDYYKPKVVLDPCCGWGGRLLGTVAAGHQYIGFEPNTETYKNLNKLIEFLHIEDKVQIYCDGAENIDKYNIKADLILTSPPYFNKEIYCDEQTQSITNFKTYEDWRDNWLFLVIKKSINCLSENGISCWNVSPEMQNDVELIHQNLGFQYDSDFGLHSSARQANQNIAKNKKTIDATICYKKKPYLKN